MGYTVQSSCRDVWSSHRHHRCVYVYRPLCKGTHTKQMSSNLMCLIVPVGQQSPVGTASCGNPFTPTCTDLRLDVWMPVQACTG